MANAAGELERCRFRRAVLLETHTRDGDYTLNGLLGFPWGPCSIAARRSLTSPPYGNDH